MVSLPQIPSRRNIVAKVASGILKVLSWIVCQQEVFLSSKLSPSFTHCLISCSSTSTPWYLGGSQVLLPGTWEVARYFSPKTTIPNKQQGHNNIEDDFCRVMHLKKSSCELKRRPSWYIQKLVIDK